LFKGWEDLVSADKELHEEIIKQEKAEFPETFLNKLK